MVLIHNPQFVDYAHNIPPISSDYDNHAFAWSMMTLDH